MESFYEKRQQLLAKELATLTAIPAPTLEILSNTDYDAKLPPKIDWNEELEKRVSEEIKKYYIGIERKLYPEVYAYLNRPRKPQEEGKIVDQTAPKIEETKPEETTQSTAEEGKGKGFPPDTDDEDISLGAPTRPQEVIIQDRQLADLKDGIIHQTTINEYTAKLEKHLYRWLRDQNNETKKDNVAWDIRRLIDTLESIPAAFGLFHGVAGRIEERFYRFREGKQSDIEQIQKLRKLTIWDFIEPYEYDHFFNPINFE